MNNLEKIAAGQYDPLNPYHRAVVRGMKAAWSGVPRSGNPYKVYVIGFVAFNVTTETEKGWNAGWDFYHKSSRD